MKRNYDKVPDEFLDDIIEWIKRSMNDEKNKNNEKLKKIIKVLNISYRSLSVAFSLSKSIIDNIKNDKYFNKESYKSNNLFISEHIYKLFLEHEKCRGKDLFLNIYLKIIK